MTATMSIDLTENMVIKLTGSVNSESGKPDCKLYYMGTP